MKAKFFCKRFLLYMAAILVPTLLLGSLYYAYVNHSVRRRIAENTAKSLTSVSSNVENVLGSAAYQQQLLTNSPRLTLSLTKIMNQDYIGYEDSVIMSVANSILTSPVNNNLYISSIYFYIAGCKKFLSTSEGLVSLEECSDSAWYTAYGGTDRSVRLWMEKRLVPGGTLRSETEVVSIYQRMMNAIGVIVVNINPKRFNQILDQVQTEPNQALLILDLQDQILFANKAGVLLQEEFSANAPQAISGSLDMVQVRIQGQAYRLSARPLEQYQIRLVSLIPETDLYRQPNQFLLFFLALVAGCVLVAALLSFGITHKNLNRIRQLLDVFARAERGEHPALSPAAARSLFKDEYDVLLGNIVNLHLSASHLQLELAEKQVLQKDAEISALQMQINPHFLFNTLQTLDMEALRKIGRQSNVNIIIRDLSDILKYSLANPSQPASLADEIKFLKLYIHIQQYRYEDKFMVYFDCPEEHLSHPAMRLMLQPLLENSLYHGIKPLAGKGYIKVRTRRCAQGLRVSVIDNGVGMSVQTLAALRERINSAHSSNIGLTNLHRRLLLRYEHLGGLHILSKPSLGTTISFVLPPAPGAGAEG